MITDPKEQQEFYGAPDTIKTPDEFKTWFNDTYVKKDKAAEDKGVRTKVSGALLGAEMTNFKRIFKENGIEFPEEEFREIESLASHKNEAMLERGVKKLMGTYVNEIETLKKSAGSGNDEKIKAIETEKEKLATKLKEVDAAWKTTASELEKEKLSGAQTLKNYQIKNLFTESFKNVKLKQKISEVERLGLDTAIERELKFDLSEKNELDVFSAKGERIISKNKAGEFLHATEAIQSIADRLGLSEINPHGGKEVGNQFANKKSETTTGNETGNTVLFRGKPVKV
ncbi:MAG: hypothetical protein ACHQF2_07315 [Flavobacteriales bacterium]|jgi:hypothetical protein